MHDAVPDQVAPLLDRQSGVATRGQLIVGGLSAAFITAQIDARRWRALNDAVVITHNGPLSSDQELWAVCLSAPGPTATSGLTALQLWGMRNVAPDRVQVLVPRGSRPLPTPGIARHVHESRRFTSADIWPVLRPVPLTSLTRSVIDAATWSPAPRTAVSLVVNAVQQRLCTAAELAAELERAGQIRHRRLLRLVLADVGGGAEAVSELEFLAFCRRHGFPQPVLQVRLDRRGRRRYLDAELRQPGCRPVRVEVDGGVHLTLTQRWNDTRHDNEASIHKDMQLRFPSVAIYLDDPDAVDQIRRALEVVRR